MKNVISRLTCLALAFLVTQCASSNDEDDLNYVAIGASDAAGIGATPLTNGYVFRIRDALKECAEDVHLSNLGIPDAEIEQFEDLEVPLALREDPDLITIFAGPNDVVSGTSPEDFEVHLERVISRLRDGTHAFIAIASIPNLTELPRFRDDPDANVTVARVVAFNAVIVRLAQRYNAVLVDLAAVPVSDNYVFEDDFHPNDAGYEKIAAEFLRVLRPQFCGN